MTTKQEIINCESLPIQLIKGMGNVKRFKISCQDEDSMSRTSRASSQNSERSLRNEGKVLLEGQTELDFSSLTTEKLYSFFLQKMNDLIFIQ